MLPPIERCTPCEELELARVRDVVPTQTLPVPNAALAGFPAGRERGELTRRRLLQGGLAGLATVYGPKLLGWDSVWEDVAQARAVDQPCIVMVYLAGGNDGMNVMIPQGDADWAFYQAKRSAIYRGRGATSGGRVGSAPLAGAAGSQLGWANVGVSSGGGGDNGAAGGFDTLYGDGSGGAGSDLAVMPAVDYLPNSLSHFNSSDVWFNGTLAPSTTGWLGRWIDRVGSDTNPFQGISIDSALSKALRTARKPVCSIPSFSNLGFTLSGGGYSTVSSGGTKWTDQQTTAQLDALAKAPVDADANPHLARARLSYALAATVAGQGSSLASAPLGTGYPPTGSLSGKLKMAALLLGAGLGTRVITIHWGSFDTHGTQLAGQDPQLSELSRALAAFKADLVSRGVEQRVSTLVFSEFGRRFADNGSGTDHGAGGLMMAMGSGVQGGLGARFPGCAKSSDLDSGGNLKVATDLRSVYSSVIAEWLRDDPAAILPDANVAPLLRGDGLSGLFRP